MEFDPDLSSAMAARLPLEEQLRSGSDGVDAHADLVFVDRNTKLKQSDFFQQNTSQR